MSLFLRPCGQPVRSKRGRQSLIPNSQAILGPSFAEGVTHSTLRDSRSCFAEDPRKTAILPPRPIARRFQKAASDARYKCILSLETAYINDLASRRGIITLIGRSQ
jgi:hypothetical protein